MIFKGIIRPHLADVRDFSQWCVAFYEEFREVELEWRKSWEDDHYISPQETENITNEMLDLVGGLVFLFHSLDNQNSKARHKTSSLELEVDNENWKVAVKKLPRNIELVDFLKWFHQLLNNRIRSLFNEYLEALADGVVDDDEKDSLQENILFILKEIIFVIVYLRNSPK